MCKTEVDGHFTIASNIRFSILYLPKFDYLHGVAPSPFKKLWENVVKIPGAFLVKK